MSDAENGALLRTVTEAYRSKANQEMNVIGLMYGLILLLVMIPLLPFLVLIWVASWLFGDGADIDRAY